MPTQFIMGSCFAALKTVARKGLWVRIPRPPLGLTCNFRTIAAYQDVPRIRVQVADSDGYERWLTTELLGDPAIARVDSRITREVVKQQR
jgi:hypothetical protein